jgi:hypothetical protein
MAYLYWWLSSCLLEYNLCNLNPCENGASCDNLPDDFNCTCAVGYSGRTCSEGMYAVLCFIYHVSDIYVVQQKY